MLPLCVDLDGTLIKNDTTFLAVQLFIKSHPFLSFPLLLIWLFRGRAYLKAQLAKRVDIDPKTLPYHLPFLQWLHSEKAHQRKLILVTATNRKFADAVAQHLNIFDDVLASDEKVNLRAHAKAAVLDQRYGKKGYDYAGNSRDDLAVWSEANQAIVVNANPTVLRLAQTRLKSFKNF